MTENGKEWNELCKTFSRIAHRYKRDAMYYEKCLKQLRGWWENEGREMAKFTEDNGLESLNMRELVDMNIDYYNATLSHEYEPAGVDLDKPNYGMFSDGR